MQRLCRIEDIGPDAGRECRLDGPDGPRSVVLLRCGDGVRAYLNVCPHMGRELNWAPDEFLLTPAGHLVCPHHGASFDVETGDCLEGPCRGDALKPVEVELRDGEVFAALDRAVRTSG